VPTSWKNGNRGRRGQLSCVRVAGHGRIASWLPTANVPHMVDQITTYCRRQDNISDMMNRARAERPTNIIDIDGTWPEAQVENAQDRRLHYRD